MPKVPHHLGGRPKTVLHGCGKAGVPLNSGAEKTVKKLNKEE
jgi:hypothetical protein